MKHLLSTLLVALLFTCPALAADHGKHLFILSGQSNMNGLDPALSFTPTVQKAFGKDNVIVVKDAKGGLPIRRWYKDWKPVKGEAPADKSKIGDLYDRLMSKVVEATKNEKIASVTFVWMQGERDAKEKLGAVYADSMRGLIDQLAADLRRDDLNFVIGRLSDHGNEWKPKNGWMAVREAQEKVADADPYGAWIDTDDLNDVEKEGKHIDDLHYTKEGFVTLGQRFADEAIVLIKKR